MSYFEEWMEKKARDIVSNYCQRSELMTMETAICQALHDAFTKGMMHTSVPRDRVSVHGSDGCMNCDTGRITIYAGHRWCIECQHKKERGTQPIK